MDHLSEISFLLPETPESRSFLDQLRSLFAEVPYADAGQRLTLTPPRPAGARPVTSFRLADVPAPTVAFDTGHTIGAPDPGEGHETRTLTATVEMADLTGRLAGLATIAGLAAI
ncbi:hypothetical protein E1265_31400, partial [Streptomyces sp. 8K308]